VEDDERFLNRTSEDLELEYWTVYYLEEARSGRQSQISDYVDNPGFKAHLEAAGISTPDLDEAESSESKEEAIKAMYAQAGLVDDEWEEVFSIKGSR